MKIGFIGLGNVGGKLAGSLLRNQFDVTVNDLNKNLLHDFETKGAKIIFSPKELTENVDLIITCLPSPKICSEVISWKRGIAIGKAICTVDNIEVSSANMKITIPEILTSFLPQ